jgi:hypothetical protein
LLWFRKVGLAGISLIEQDEPIEADQVINELAAVEPLPMRSPTE